MVTANMDGFKNYIFSIGKSDLAFFVSFRIGRYF